MTSINPPSIKTRDAIKAFPSQRQLALALGISAQAIQNWGEYVPTARAYMLRELRPDLFEEKAA